ncbi:effector-associated constant component EACC1 [Rhodanobacter glycinis]|uniref:effector-associated constant component EACC1 n=1 Tax=Rhodanobacter glycinis TaxID=582702 RepID=UPI000B87B6BB|nr:hypothetical protein [Rhodanobacter glycinis]
MRVALFKDSQGSFTEALEDAGIPYEELRPVPGQVMAAGTLITIALTTAITGPIATVLVAWLRARASRKVMLTLRDKTIVHLEGYSVEQVQQVLELVEYATVIDTKPAE